MGCSFSSLAFFGGHEGSKVARLFGCCHSGSDENNQPDPETGKFIPQTGKYCSVVQLCTQKNHSFDTVIYAFDKMDGEDPGDGNDNRECILFCHGAGSHISCADPAVSCDLQCEFLSRTFHVDVVACEYIGYGENQSGENASLEGLYETVDATFQYMISTLHYEPSNVVLWGFSLGGHAVLHLASTLLSNNAFSGIRGVVLQSAFTSWHDAIRSSSAINPCVQCCFAICSCCCSDSITNIDLVQQLRGIPLICLHGVDDELVPPLHSLILYNHWCAVNGLAPFRVPDDTAKGTPLLHVRTKPSSDKKVQSVVLKGSQDAKHNIYSTNIDPEQDRRMSLVPPEGGLFIIKGVSHPCLSLLQALKSDSLTALRAMFL